MKDIGMQIGVTEVFVGDQDKARTFYAGVLGLHVKTDAAHGESARWLTVVSPETGPSCCWRW
jgi:catechol 2,3-dioxygenase-like lactoylglutathione lyase family enzyme